MRTGSVADQERGAPQGAGDEPNACIPSGKDPDPAPTTTRNARIVEMLPMIKAIAWNVSRTVRMAPQMDRDDLVQEGVIGLAEALDRYDADRGPVASYCRLRVRGAMIDALRGAGVISRRRGHGEFPPSTVSIDDPNGDGATLYDTIPAPDLTDEIDDREHATALVADAVAVLPDREAAVLCLELAGMNGIRISRVLGVHSSRVSQNRTRAVGLLRRWLRADASEKDALRRKWTPKGIDDPRSFPPILAGREADIVAAHKSGRTRRELAREFGVAPSTMVRACQILNLSRARPGPPRREGP